MSLALDFLTTLGKGQEFEDLLKNDFDFKQFKVTAFNFSFHSRFACSNYAISSTNNPTPLDNIYLCIYRTELILIMLLQWAIPMAEEQLL